ncbi:hypothetical protein H4R20_004008 [Coemansia guatemalensis]|uniref:Myb-like domain-containing protein n=1 Tax=Coemansia guatemalensis TaxID=2761395 RepID=A0A9W8HV88_9FUNG|nr:hypothetical protein H4R20_004008 [Coemansia guatemalensis]
MSSATSLRVSKGSSKFAPKTRPRAVKRTKNKQKEATAEETQTNKDDGRSHGNTEARENTPTRQPAISGDEAEDEPLSSSTQQNGIPIVGQSSQRDAAATIIGVPKGREEQGGEVPAVSTTTQRRPSVRPSGTPIVIGAPSPTPPRVTPQLPSARRPSVVGSPIGGPAMPQRLASLSSPINTGGSRPTPLRLIHSNRDRTSTPQLGSPVKRRRGTDGTPEPVPLPRLKTTEDYPVLSTEEINSLPIAYFCRDPRHGKPTKEFIDRENAALRKLHEPPESDAASPDASETSSQPLSNLASPTKGEPAKPGNTPDTPASRMAAQVRVINGKVVIDTDSLTISRSDMAGVDNEPMGIVDESERPRFINSLTYVKRRTTRKRWTNEETTEFYRALRKFGSDFEMIASVMPGRCRYDIRNKFKLEEKKHPQWITDTLLKRPPPASISETNSTSSLSQQEASTNDPLGSAEPTPDRTAEQSVHSPAEE